MLCKDLLIKGIPYFVPPTPEYIEKRKKRDMEELCRRYEKSIQSEIDRDLNLEPEKAVETC